MTTAGGEKADKGMRILHIGGYWRGPNDIVRQMMLGLSEAGYEVYEYNTDEHQEALDTDGRVYDRGTYGPVWLREEEFRPLIEKFRPQVTICNAGGLGFRAEFAAQLRKQVALLGIALSDPDVFEPATRHIAPGFDYFLTNSQESVAHYRAMGVRAERLPFATSAQTFHPVAVRPELVTDVLILGRGLNDRIEPARALLSRFTVHLYGEEWESHGLPSRGFALGEEALAALSAARITVIFNKSHSGHPIIKPQLFDFLAAGAFVLTNHWEGIEEYFSFGKHLVGFTSTEELLQKVAYYLAHPDAAQAIREAGRQQVIQNYTWAQVWPKMIHTTLQGSQGAHPRAPNLWRKFRHLLGGRD
jgi:spore maturation protein CgeB